MKPEPPHVWRQARMPERRRDHIVRRHWRRHPACSGGTARARARSWCWIAPPTRLSGRRLGGNGLPRRKNQSLVPLLDLAAAVDDEGHFLAVFHRPDGHTFGGGFDYSDLRITRGFKLGYKLLLGQGKGRREDANHHQTAKDRLRDCSRRHDLCSLAVASRENVLRDFNAYPTQRIRPRAHAVPRPARPRRHLTGHRPRPC